MKHKKKGRSHARPALLPPNAHEMAHLNESLLKLACSGFTGAVPKRVAKYARQQQFVPLRRPDAT
jgi:hypothetical protein